MTQTSERRPEVADFGPDQGAITAFNLRPMQVAIGAAGLLGLWAAISTVRNLLAWTVVFFVWTVPLLLAALLRVPYTHKYLDQHIGPWLRWRLWKLTGKAKRQPITGTLWSPADLYASKVTAPDQAPPPELAHVELLDYTDPHGRHVGLVFDRRLKTYTVVMQIEASKPGIGGLDHLEQTLRGWERVLAGVAQHGTTIRRFQWLLVAAPDDGTRLHADFQARATVRNGQVAQMYEQLTREAGPTNTIHETYLAVQVDQRPAADEDFLDGSVFAASATYAVKAARKVAHDLAQTSYHVVHETLAPGQLGRLVRLLYCPQQRASLDTQPEGLPYAAVWPKKIDRDYRGINTDGARHRVFELFWPTEKVGAGFLDHLAVLPGTAHALSVVYQPLNRETEIQSSEWARGKAVAKDVSRWKRGFIKPRKVERQEDVNEGYLGELLSGSEGLRVTAWAMVSAAESPSDLDDLANFAKIPHDGQTVLSYAPGKAIRRRLEASEQALKAAATYARVTLVARDGVHAQAMTHVLPFCKGTEGSWL